MKALQRIIKGPFMPCSFSNEKIFLTFLSNRLQNVLGCQPSQISCDKKKLPQQIIIHSLHSISFLVSYQFFFKLANYVFQLLLALVAILDYRLTQTTNFAEEVAILDYRSTHKKTNCAEDYPQNNSGMVQQFQKRRLKCDNIANGQKMITDSK